MEAQDPLGAEVAAEARDPVAAARAPAERERAAAEGERAAAEGEGTEERETPAKEVRMGLPATRGAEALVSKLPAKAAALAAAVSEGVGVLLLARSLVSPTMTNVVTLASRKKTNSKEARRKGG